jgi:hypothetical protein
MLSTLANLKGPKQLAITPLAITWWTCALAFSVRQQAVFAAFNAVVLQTSNSSKNRADKA